MRKSRSSGSSKAIMKWDEELAKEAQLAAELEANASAGQFFSTQGGVLSWQDSPLPNNEMAVIVLASVFENLYYDTPYDPDVPQNPTCFALAEEEENLAPHHAVVDAGQAQSGRCAECPHNEWGSADRGKGRACRNVRRLALLPAGQLSRNGFELFEDPVHYETIDIGFLKLPVTSVRGYARYVKQLAGALRRPPFGVISHVSLVPDQKTQFKIVFEAIQKVPDELMPAIMARREEARSTIDFPYSLDEQQEQRQKPLRANARRRSRRRRRKY